MRAALAWAVVIFTLTLSSPASRAQSGGGRTANGIPPRLSDQHVVLLTSLDMASIRLPFYLFWKRPYYRKYESRMENAFRQYFESRGYSVDIEGDSTQADLWRVL